MNRLLSMLHGREKISAEDRVDIKMAQEAGVTLEEWRAIKQKALSVVKVNLKDDKINKVLRIILEKLQHICPEDCLTISRCLVSSYTCAVENKKEVVTSIHYSDGLINNMGCR